MNEYSEQFLGSRTLATGLDTFSAAVWNAVNSPVRELIFWELMENRVPPMETVGCVPNRIGEKSVHNVLKYD